MPIKFFMQGYFLGCVVQSIVGLLIYLVLHKGC